MMANYLILDANDVAINCVALAIPDGGRMVVYDGPFYAGGKFDGTVVADPNPASVVAHPAISAPTDSAVQVL
jgi:hypothetical protein